MARRICIADGTYKKPIHCGGSTSVVVAIVDVEPSESQGPQRPNCRRRYRSPYRNILNERITTARAFPCPALPSQVSVKALINSWFEQTASAVTPPSSFSA